MLQIEVKCKKGPRNYTAVHATPYSNMVLPSRLICWPERCSFCVCACVFPFVGPRAEECGSHALVERLSTHTNMHMNAGTSSSCRTTTEFTYHAVL